MDSPGRPSASWAVLVRSGGDGPVPRRLAVALKPMFEEQAKERQRAAGHKGGVIPASLPEAVKGDARDQAAAAVGVSGRLRSSRCSRSGQRSGNAEDKAAFHLWKMSHK
jgi:hypothetical protein